MIGTSVIKELRNFLKIGHWFIAVDNGHFNGTQFTQDQQDKTRTLLYDANGKVAGIQMIVSEFMLKQGKKR